MYNLRTIWPDLVQHHTAGVAVGINRWNLTLNYKSIPVCHWHLQLDHHICAPYIQTFKPSKVRLYPICSFLGQLFDSYWNKLWLCFYQQKYMLRFILLCVIAMHLFQMCSCEFADRLCLVIASVPVLHTSPASVSLARLPVSSQPISYKPVIVPCHLFLVISKVQFVLKSWFSALPWSSVSVCPLPVCNIH